MKCRCGDITEATFEGHQEWCRGCGRLYWVNPDGSVRGVREPKVLTQNTVEAKASNDQTGANRAW